MEATCVNPHCVDGWIPAYERKFNPEDGFWYRFVDQMSCLCCQTKCWTEAPGRELIEIKSHHPVYNVSIPLDRADAKFVAEHSEHARF